MVVGDDFLAHIVIDIEETPGQKVISEDIAKVLVPYKLFYSTMSTTSSKRNCKLRDQSVLLHGSSGGWGKESPRLYRNPDFSLSCESGKTILTTRDQKIRTGENILQVLEGFLAQGYTAVGYIGYEFFRNIPHFFESGGHKGGFGLPDAHFLLFDEEKSVKEIENLETMVSSIGHNRENPKPNMSRREYIEMVQKAQSYIKQGDIFQVNLSQRFEVPFKRPPREFLTELYDKQPVPFACHLDFGSYHLVSGSMELFLKKRGRKITTRPIKGTRPRKSDREKDRKMISELKKNEKEKAENIMIVDLMRNDLGRICKFGSVEVDDLLKVETYSTLHQMVSEVEGRLRNGVRVRDIIEATFPPGSVTGAPKNRSMEIIEELEPHIRGPYCGAIGVFSPSGDVTLSVAIRIVVVKGSKARFWMGGGIVWDSIPEKEHEETLTKARATMNVLEGG